MQQRKWATVQTQKKSYWEASVWIKLCWIVHEVWNCHPKCCYSSLYAAISIGSEYPENIQSYLVNKSMPTTWLELVNWPGQKHESHVWPCFRTRNKKPKKCPKQIKTERYRFLPVQHGRRTMRISASVLDKVSVRSPWKLSILIV